MYFSFKFLPLILLFQRLCIFGFFCCFFNCGKHNAFPCLYMRSLYYQSQKKRWIVLRSAIRNQYHGTKSGTCRHLFYMGLVPEAWETWGRAPLLAEGHADWLQLEPACWLETQTSLILLPSGTHGLRTVPEASRFYSFQDSPKLPKDFVC